MNKTPSPSEFTNQNRIRINEESKISEQNFTDMNEQLHQPKIYTLPVVQHTKAQRVIKVKKSNITKFLSFLVSGIF
jgi:hypothetical protein